MRRSRPRRLLAVLALLALTLILLDARGTDDGPLGALRRGSDAVFGPTQSFLGGTVNQIAEAFEPDGDAAQLRRTNAALRRRVIELEEQVSLGVQAQELLRLKDAGTYTTVLARVVGYGQFQPFESTVTIDAGSKDGVAEGMTVTSGAGLVGKIIRVGPVTSTLALLVDPIFSAGVRVSGAAGSFGLVSGDGQGRLRLRVVQFAAGRPLQVGSALVTSGEGTIAGGLPVGRLTKVGALSGGQSRTAIVAPFAELGALDLVQVILDGPREQPRVPIPPAPR